LTVDNININININTINRNDNSINSFIHIYY